MIARSASPVSREFAAQFGGKVPLPGKSRAAVIDHGGFFAEQMNSPASCRAEETYPNHGHDTSAPELIFTTYTHDGRWDRGPSIAASPERRSQRNRLREKIKPKSCSFTTTPP